MKQFFLLANSIKQLVNRVAKPAIFSGLITLILIIIIDSGISFSSSSYDAIDFIPATGTPRASLTTSGLWDSGPKMPRKLGEVSSGVINGVLYVVGEGSNATLAYNIAAGTWRDNLAVRPFVGNHHAAEVFNGKFYLLGGLRSGAGKVQIYDPVTNTWSLDANMPFAAGSSSSAVIGGQIYVAGGIVGSSTTNQVAK